MKKLWYLLGAFGAYQVFKGKDYTPPTGGSTVQDLDVTVVPIEPVRDNTSVVTDPLLPVGVNGVSSERSLFNPTPCNDGEFSSSTGSGSCSYHGGLRY